MLRPLALSLVLAAGCSSDSSLSKAGDYAGTGGPDIEVDPPTLDFGSAGAGETVTQTFAVRNVGSGVLTVEGVAIAGTVSSFTILTEDTSFEVPEGGEEIVEVAFTPLGANDQRAEAVVDSDDEDEPKVPVELLGEGLVPELQIDPDPVDFGDVYVGCDGQVDATLTNVGTDELVISSIAQSGDAFTMFDGNTLPLSLDPGASAAVTLLFSPTADRSEHGELVVASNEPLGTRAADIEGVGKYAGEYAEQFEVPEDPPADIVFFVDQSCSMDDDARNLASQFSSFIGQLSNYTTDWHVMVANDDDGCNNSGILTSRSTDYEGRFETAVSQGGGNYTEAGLTVTSRAIDKTDSGECNDNFLRSSAILHIILVSDEPEQSGGSWQSYVDQVIAKKGDASLVKFSAVAGDVPGGCSSSGNSADPGTGYYDAVNYTGGEWLSICSSWSSHVGALADASVEMDTFDLAHTPIASTIEVSVNGSVRTNGWSYDANDNAIVFDATHLPEEGDVIDVTYAGIANCD